MMTNKLLSQSVLLSLCFALFQPQLSDGFNGEAHRRLSRLAVDPNLTNASQLDSFLKNVLAFEFENGVNEPIQGGQGAIDLIAQGSVDEDKPDARVLFHFHDPTKTWNMAGYLGLNPSSVVWSQAPVQGAGATRTWKTARDAYFKALTSTTSSQRKQWYAETFRTLGHLIHHVQDAAVPSHTRSDTHFAPSEKSTFPLGDRFHNWADANLATIDESIQLSGIRRFTPSVLDQTSPNQYAPVPIARILDKTDNDFGVLSPNLNIGLAEYSNANFFSEHTVLSTAYQYPRLSQLQIGSLETSPSGHPRRYLRFRPGFGEQNYRVSTYSTMLPYIGAPLPLEFVDIGLDNNVFKDYGLKLFPRAIGYSAGLIDYFFRGKIDSRPWPEGYLWVPWGQRPSSIRVDNVSVKVDGTNEQGGQGTMQLVLLYSYRYANTPSGAPRFVASQPVSVSGGTQTVVFPFDSLPFPVTSPSVSGSHGYVYFGLLVYKGALGQESQAVVADSYCIDPKSGSRYDRWYVFEHGPALDGKPIESAYMSEC